MIMNVTDTILGYMKFLNKIFVVPTLGNLLLLSASAFCRGNQNSAFGGFVEKQRWVSVLQRNCCLYFDACGRIFLLHYQPKYSVHTFNKLKTWVAPCV